MTILPIHQGVAAFRLQSLDLLADGGLGPMQLLARRAKGALLDNGAQVPQRFYGHIRIPYDTHRII